MIDLSAVDIWRQPYFHEQVIAGLRRDGYSEDLLKQVQNVLSQADVISPAIFMASLRRDRNQIPLPLVAEFDRLLLWIEETHHFNTTWASRETPEKTRVVQWPNNPQIRVQRPEHYVDIYKDYFYRSPRRFIKKTTPIGSAGSCFASRIAHQLQLWGYSYVIEEDDLPKDIPVEDLPSTEYRMAPARCGTLFNIPSMRQMIERAFGLWQPRKVVVRDGERWLDPFRAITSTYTDEAGYEKDYAAHTEAIRRALLKCDVFILTLGLTEAWQFADSGDYTSVSPWKVPSLLLRAKELTVEENVAELERLLAVYQRFRPGIRLIISVSPVPLNKTFSQQRHVVEANCFSKSVLRVAAEQFCRRHPDCVDYFPSYEMVMYGTPRPWEDDMRHVSADAVERVMRLFQTMFLVDQEPLAMQRVKEAPALKAQPIRQTLRRIKHGAKRVAQTFRSGKRSS